MIKVIYKKQDLRYVFFTTDTPKELTDLEQYLNKIPQFQFMPSFRGVPKPVVFLNKFKTQDGKLVYWCHSGLWKCVYDWCEANHIEINGIDNTFKYTKFSLSLEEFQEYVINWELNLDPYDYQVRAAWMILHYRESLSELATRAGKTLVAYIVFRYMLENGAKNILMIVPSIHLVKQGVEDFKEYKEFFQTETVWAKGEFCECANLTIGTYQSLVQRADKKSKKYDPKFFNKYDIVMTDECHHLVAKSLNMILGLDFMKNVKLRFGFTGTLPQQHSIESFCCQALMGPKIQELKTYELQEQGFLANLDITQIEITYIDNQELTDLYIKCGEYLNSSYQEDEDGGRILLPKEERDMTIQHVKELPFALKQLKGQYTKEEYKDYLIDLCKAKGSNLLMLEQMVVHRSEKRIKIMESIIRKNSGNCIVFAHHTEYLKLLKKRFENTFSDRPVYIITGSESLKKRLKVIENMLTDNDAILCASYGCCSTGITFKNVDYGIFAQSFKSEIIIRQSIGRGLLKTETKDTFYVYDMIDILPTKRLMMQGIEKRKIYRREKFPCKVLKL